MPLDQFHDDGRAIAFFHQRMDGDDGTICQCRHATPLGEDSIAPRLCRPPAQDLDGDCTVEGFILGTVYRPQCAAADDMLDAKSRDGRHLVCIGSPPENCQRLDGRADARLDLGAQLFRESALPLIADESCAAEEDVPRCVDHFHGINIKLCKCGGLTPARRMIANARDHGLKVMVGCMIESSVGISAAAQLAPLLDYADLDGAVLLAKDAADGVQLRQGKLIFPDEPGLGIRALK